MGACEDRKDGATGWASACVVTNYGCRGCRGLCRGCTAEGAVRVPERHGGDVAYVVNGTVYRSYGAIASFDGVPVAQEAMRMAAGANGMAICPWLGGEAV